MQLNSATGYQGCFASGSMAPLLLLRYHTSAAQGILTPSRHRGRTLSSFEAALMSAGEYNPATRQNMVIAFWSI